MRLTLSSFVAVLCLLTLFISSAACLALPQNTIVMSGTQHEHVASAPDHACCPQRNPVGEHTSTTCCTVHHQPVTVASAVVLEQPNVTSHAISPVSSPTAAAIYPSASIKIEVIEQPPLIALRI